MLKETKLATQGHVQRAKAYSTEWFIHGVYTKERRLRQNDTSQKT